MDRKNFSNIGDEIKDIVQNAVNTRDFHQLNRDIQSTVGSAMDELKRSIGLTRNDRFQNNWDNNFDDGYQQNNNDPNWNRQFWDRQDWNRQSRTRHNRTRQNGYRHWRNADSYTRTSTYPDNKNQTSSPFTVPVGRVSGILCTVFGWIGIGLLGIAIIVLGILGTIFDMDLYYTIIAGLSPLLLGSIYLTSKGNSIRKRLQRFQQYNALFRNKNYCMIKELAQSSGLSEKYIQKDLRKMIAIGMFPEGHIDRQKTCFMLNNESFEQYRKLQENIKTQQAEAQKQKEENIKNPKTSASEHPELRKIIEEGKSYVRQIREANDAIPGEEISQKLYRLEHVTSKIFDYVELHPEQISDIQKFMDYYLPTTSKLLIAYREFDMQPVQGENITTAKKEIESTLDTINLAFENLLDSLFQDTAMDISADISVLHTMLKQEGLTEKDF